MSSRSVFWRVRVCRPFSPASVNDKSGATAIEYGLIAAIVGVGIIAGLGTLKNTLSSMFANVSTNLNVN